MGGAWGSRRMLSWGLGWLALLASLACNRVEVAGGEGPTRPDPAPPPNLLLVTIDTLRADHVGAYGATDAATPTLDGLAADGVRFDVAIAPTPLTLPSHATLLTGLEPPRHGVRHNGVYRLEDRIETLAEILSAAGYATGAVVGAAVLDASYGLDQGFAWYDDGRGAEESAVLGYAERPAGEVTERALAWLDDAPSPFFLWIHYYDPHALYRPPAPFDAHFAAHPYAGEIAYVDAELGRVLAALRGAGRFEETIVIATSDHGESLGEHHELTHGYTLYDAALRVPLIVRGPGVPRARVVASVVGSIDVMPTLLALAGLEPVAGLDGRPLQGLWSLEAIEPPPRPVYAETLATRLDHGWSALHALRSERFLYVRAPHPELYDVQRDPAQKHNLLEAEENEALARPLAQELEVRTRAGAASAPLSIDADQRAQLRALGYELSATPVPSSGLDPKEGLRRLEPYAKATQAFARGDLEAALALAEQARAALPESARVQGLLAGIQVRLGRSDRALPLAEAAVRSVPSAAEYRQLLGDVRYNVGDLEGSIAAYREARALAPESRFVRERLAWLEAQRDSEER